MNRRIKQVWLLAILSSFLLIGLQTYWLYNSVTYSMGEMGKKNAEKAERAIIAYLTNIGAAVKEKSHIGYVVSAYFSDFKGPCTTVCSPLDTDTIIGGMVYRKPGFGNVMEKRDTFDLRETDSNNSFDCLNTYITYQLTRFDKAHFDRFVSRKLGNDFIGAEMKTGKASPLADKNRRVSYLVSSRNAGASAFQSYPVSVDADEDAGADAAHPEGNDVADDRKSAGYHHASSEHSLSHQGDAPAEEGG